MSSDAELRSSEARARSESQPLVLIPLCRRGDRTGIERQIASGAPLEEIDIEGNTPLHVAVEAPKNEIATVQCLLEHGANVNALNDLGASPLHYVCLRRSNQRGIANLLLEHGAELDAQTSAGKSALHFACEQQLPEFVEVLCLSGANPCLSDAEGNSPMHLAVSKPGGRDTVKRQICELLIANKGALQSPNLQGYRPVHLACRGGYIHCLQLLVDFQADCTAQTGAGETGLHLACASNFSEVTQLLLQVAPAALNQQDSDGNTPLHLCAAIGNLDSALLLLRMDADASVRNADKKTALDLSKIKGTDLDSTHNPELVQILKDTQQGGSCRQS